MTERLLYETHSHTPLCKHAFGQPEEYASVAWFAGLKGLIVTCHNPMPHGFSADVRMGQDEFEEYQRIIAQARKTWNGRIDVRLGLECDYFPGFESWLETQVQSAPFDYILGSVHPQTSEFRDRFWTGDAVKYQLHYFEQLAIAAETGWFDCLAHPDLVKNETAAAWQPDQIMDKIRCSLDRIATTGVAMELNTSGLHKVIPEMNPFPEMLREMTARSIPVVIGADAHRPERVGESFVDALELLWGCGFEHVSLFLDRERCDIPIQSALESVREHAMT